MQQLPALTLSYGQLLWALRYGQEPDQRFKDQARYLRQLGIPRAACVDAKGSGRRLAYHVLDLFELGFAVTGLDLGFKPRDIVSVLVDSREEMWSVYHQVWASIPHGALCETWVRSRGRLVPIDLDEQLLRLHDKREQRWDKFDLLTFEEAHGGCMHAPQAPRPFEPVERYAGEMPRRLIPMKRLMLQWVAWATIAPAIRPGRKSSNSKGDACSTKPY